MLSVWMQQSAIKFFKTSDRNTVLLALKSQRKFWLSFPAVMTALTLPRPPIGDANSIISVTRELVSNYSLLTAALVKFDHETLQLALASHTEQEEELALFSIECLYVWLDLLYIEERETSTGEHVDGASSWTSSEMSKLLCSPLIVAHGNSTQWISAFACDLASFANTPELRLRDLTLVTCIISDCAAADYRRNDAALAESTTSCAAKGIQHIRETWLTLSEALSTIIEKNISILSSEMANRLFRALSKMFSLICQSDNRGERSQADGIDLLIESYRVKYPEATPEMLLKTAPWEWRLGVLSKLIQSGLMKLRVMAVNILCGYLTEVWTQEEATLDGRQFLCQLGHIVDNELTGYIVSPSCHPEIIVASTSIMVFLALSDANTKPLLDRVWRSIGSSEDQRVADAITRVAIHTLSVLRYNHLVYLCEKFDEVELGDFSPLLRSLWESLLSNMVSKAQVASRPLTAHPFLSILRVLREMPTCDNGANFTYPDLHKVAVQRVRELLQYGLEADVRKQLYANCAQHLASDSQNRLGSLWFISICMRPAIVNELQHLTDAHDIVRVVVEDLGSAVHTACDLSTVVLAGPANYARRDLISQIIHFQPKSITEELGTRLWEVLVGAKARNTADRVAAWQTISTVGNNSSFQNPFLQACFSKHLPNLSASWYCEGMLNFVRENVLLLVNHHDEFNLDHEELVAKSGIEHLWRIILSSHDENIAQPAMILLASGVYLESKTIAACTVNRAQSIHLKLVRQCLKLMREARHALQAAPIDGDADDDSLVVVEPEREMVQRKREFLRTLRLLQYFLDAHRANPRYSAADLRPLIPKCAEEMKGEPTNLQYQAFGDDDSGEVKSLQIGRENSLGSLLAVFRDETGFDSYKAYYRGRQLVPSEMQVSKSLQDLHMCDGLVLLNKDVAASDMPSHVKPGSSRIEIEILAQFSEFWQYLAMEESIAAETYNFLLRLPADGQLMQCLRADGTRYEDHFVPDQPYRLLYTIFALMESVKDISPRQTISSARCSPTTTEYESSINGVGKALQLLARGLDDQTIIQVPGHVNILVASNLIFQYMRLLDAALQDVVSAQVIPKPSPLRLLSILDDAMSSQEEELLHLSAKCLSLILKLGFVDEQFWLAVAGSPLLANLMRRMCVLSNQKDFRIFCISQIEEITKKEAETAEKHGHITKYFWNWALETLVLIPDLGENCHELMKLMCFLVVQIRYKCYESVDLGSLVQQLIKYLISHTCTEEITQATPCDLVAEGLVTLLNRCLHLDESLAQHIPRAAIFCLMKGLLFPQEQHGMNESLPKIILNPEIRGKLYESIFLNLRTQNDLLLETIEFLGEMVPFYANSGTYGYSYRANQKADIRVAEPYIYDLPFQFEQEKALRSPAGYVGLQNLSNTCYLNSLITQLYMNPGFRGYLMSFDVGEADDSKTLLHETQRLFVYLQESISRSVDPTAFVGAIKTYDQGPIDIHSQMDVDEFYNLLFDRWEAQLPSATARKKFRSIYGGQLVQQIKSKECGHISERLEPFSAIQCDIKGKSTLEDSLRAYVGGETMDGDNKYKCSSCDRHVEAVKRACLKDVPDNVIFHLKRFEFHLQTLQRSKIDDYFAFPDRLDLQPYTIEHLSGSAPDDKQDMFELVGVLVHAGTAESGHYYSYVRERSSDQDTTSKWVEFNDDQVGIWNYASVEASTFGGPERRSGYGESSLPPFDKSYSAYMLFYQRISPRTEAAETQPAPKGEGGKSLYTAKGEALKDHIRTENILLLRRHCLFDPNHAKFVQACVHQSLRPKSSPEVGLELDSQLAEEAKAPKVHQLAMSTAMSYLDQIFSRSKDCSHAVIFCNLLADVAMTQQGCAWQVIKYLQGRPAVLRSLLLRNPERSVRVAIGQLFVICLQKLSSSCPELFYAQTGTATPASDDEDEDMKGDAAEPENMLSCAMEPLNQLWKYFQNHIRSWDEYFSTIVHVAQLGRQECAMVLAGGYLEKCLKIITADRSVQIEPNFVKMLQNLYRRFSTQPPSYVAVLALIAHLMDQLEPEISHESIVETADERLTDTGGCFPWTSSEITLLLTHPEREDTSLFLARLLEINQGPEITRRILERVIRAGEIPTRKLLCLLETTIRGDASTEPLDAYIRAALIFVDSCSDVSDAQHLVRHIGMQAASFERGEGGVFLELMRRAIDNKRSDEEERAQLRRLTLHTIPEWAPYLLQYSDSRVRNETERLVDMVLCLPVEVDSPSAAEAAVLSSNLARAIGTRCLTYIQDAHNRRQVSIERELAAVLIRVVSNCSLVVTASETLDQLTKEEFIESQHDIITDLLALVVDRVDDDGSDWEGSALSSEPMDEDAEAEEVMAHDGK
ncbi:ubiquitin C-terminal hydrolase [Cordyceps militaris]|uniref:Ubiquitin C-terminal hydrolase n=1 Tax=Cordyceps militaris TaxID=73501 RepID=A0A2H4SJH5_CORMI|nr:ubiquitin C-terminal hydrolase [Cordyceps militaris]